MGWGITKRSGGLGAKCRGSAPFMGTAAIQLCQAGMWALVTRSDYFQEKLKKHISFGEIDI